LIAGADGARTQPIVRDRQGETARPGVRVNERERERGDKMTAPAARELRKREKWTAPCPPALLSAAKNSSHVMRERGERERVEVCGRVTLTVENEGRSTEKKWRFSRSAFLTPAFSRPEKERDARLSAFSTHTHTHIPRTHRTPSVCLCVYARNRARKLPHSLLNAPRRRALPRVSRRRPPPHQGRGCVAQARPVRPKGCRGCEGAASCGGTGGRRAGSGRTAFD